MGGGSTKFETASFGDRSLQQMHQWVNGGPGANAMYNASDLWANEKTYMQDLANRVQDRMKQARAVMESQSGDAVQNAVAPVVLWTESTADNASAQSDRMKEQGEAFAKVQKAVPNPNEQQKVPSENWFQTTWASITDSKTDAQKAQGHNEQLRQEAVTAFNNYQETTKSTVGNTPSFTAPPAIATNTSVQGGSQGGVGGFSSPGGAGGYSGGAGGGVSGGGGSSYGGGGSVGALPTSHMSTSSPIAPPNVTHSASAVPSMPSMPSMPTPNIGGGTTGGASGGGFGGFSGVIGGGSAGGAVSAGGRAGTIGQAAAASSSEPEPEGGSTGSTSASSSTSGARGGQKLEEDDEHYTPEFLKGDHGFFDDDIPRVAPPVFGE